MKPITFPGFNVVLGANQPEYQPLPALKIPGPEGEMITCWELSDDEIEAIKRNGCIYFSQLTFNQPFQPVMPMAELGDNINLIPD